MIPRPTAALAAALLLAAAPAGAALTYPPTRVEVVRDTLHGVVIEDPYRWLEDKDSPETRAWVRAQMALTQSELAKVPGRDAVVASLAKFSRVDARTVPTLRGNRLFFETRAADQQQPVLVMREGPSGADVVLVDPNPMSPDHTTSVTLEDVSLDGTMIAYGIRHGGEDEVEPHLMDVTTRTERPLGLAKGRYFTVSIDGPKQGCWYALWGAKGSRVRYHRFGDDAAKDRLVFGEGLGPTEIPFESLSPDGHWLAIGVAVGSSGDDTRWYLQDVQRNGPIVTVADTLHAGINVDFAGDQLVVETNWKAPHHRVLVADLRAPQFTHWKEIVPESKTDVIEGFACVGGRLYVRTLRNVVSHVLAYDLTGKPLGELALPGLGSAGTPNGEWAGREAYFSYSSFNQPTTIFHVDVATSKADAWWTSSAPFDASRYEVHQFSVKSTGGATVPFFVVSAKGLAFDGSHPVLLTGYGGFNLSMTPNFSPLAAAWLDLGGVYVLANMRGGSEFGEAWHRDGMLGNKQHVFDDFLAVAQWLEASGYCTASRLAIIGDSNGGLLVGAAMTQRPELFGAVVCQVPLLDMLRYQRFLVARFWVPEYGSSENPEQFQWLYAYSPYQHVRKGVTYPPVMFVSGDSDTRVDPLHARKMTALMQSLGGPNPVLLHYDVSSGHAGGKSVDKDIDDHADVIQFLRGELGMAK